MKQVFTMLGGLRKAMSELDNSLPDYLFDEGQAHDEGLLELINNLWDEIEKTEKQIDKMREEYEQSQ